MAISDRFKVDSRCARLWAVYDPTTRSCPIISSDVSDCRKWLPRINFERVKYDLPECFVIRYDVEGFNNLISHN